MGSRRFRPVLGLLLLALALEVNRWLERVQVEHPPLHSLYLPAGRYLRYASLGNPGLLADLLYVWSIQYYSTDRAERWRHLPQLYDVITDLDPRFLAAYSIGAIILGLEAGDRRASLRLLDKGIERIPETYQLAFEAGFYARELGDPARASSYFAIAKDRPDAPAFVRRWHAFTLDKVGRREDALAVWNEALRVARDDNERMVAERHIHDLQLDAAIEATRGAVSRFAADNGRPPLALEELVRRGYLSQVPRDPEGAPLLYDRRTGEVKSESGFLLLHRFGG